MDEQIFLSFKIYLLRKQLVEIKFNFSISKLREFCLFGIQIYLKNWYEARISIYSTLNDLNLYKSLLNYDHKAIRDGSVKSFRNHLQYLTTVLSTFSFFDERISDKCKEKWSKI